MEHGRLPVFKTTANEQRHVQRRRLERRVDWSRGSAFSYSSLAAAWDMRRPLESNDRLAVRGERAKELEPRGERADTESERLRENLDQEVPVTEPGRRTWTRVNWVGQDKS